jgi:hypothetical protein
MPGIGMPGIGMPGIGMPGTFVLAQKPELLMELLQFFIGQFFQIDQARAGS